MRGLEKCTIDRWYTIRDHRVVDEFRCCYSISANAMWGYGPEYRCSKIVGHYGDHKWYESDEHGDYDLWWSNHKYDYQLEEL